MSDHVNVLSVRRRIRRPFLFLGLTALVSGAIFFGANISHSADAAQSKGSRLKVLMKERVEILRRAVELSTGQYKAGELRSEEMIKATEALSSAELELCDTDAERVVALKKLLQLATEQEALSAMRAETGEVLKIDALNAGAARLTIEIALERIIAK